MMSDKERDEEDIEAEDAEYDTLDDDEDDGIITLLDEDNNEVNFRLVDVTEYKGKKYVILVPAEPIEGYDDSDVVIMELIEKDETLEAVVDDDLAQKIFDAYNEEEDEEEMFGDELE